MAGSRLLDIQARRMREKGQGFYTIGSAGHESNALVAAALRTTDPALLHYRSGGFFLMRALLAGRSIEDVLRAVLLGTVAAVADRGLRRPAQGVGRPVAGRHSADVDHRVAPAACGRRRLRDRTRAPAGASRRAGPTTRSRCAASATRR